MRYCPWLALIACVAIALVSTTASPALAEDAPQYKLVTCGSTMKREHKNSQHMLHSHPINWGSGSGQQSVTACKTPADTNDLWNIREGDGQPPCVYGDAIRCGAIIRLLHSNTNKFLHSHNHRSPLSGRQEVSAFDSASSNGGTHTLSGSRFSLQIYVYLYRAFFSFWYSI